MKPYPAYKGSGIEWIGEIPEHWEIKKLSYLTNIQGRIGFKGYTKSDLVAEGEGALTLGGKHINSNNRLNLSDAEYISWDKYYESPEIMVKKNNIIVSQRGTLGKVLLIEDDIGEATINPSLVLLNNIKIYEKFLYYFLTSDYICKKVELNNTATAVPMISQEQLSSFKILIPSIFEQHLVSNFLDHKTSQIDTLIEKKQKQIELLKEERTAIINQAVTKGLNPDVPMKDSGIEWLGEVPEHWEITKLKYIIKTLISGVSVNSSDEPAEAHEYGVLKTSCVYTGEFNVNENKKIVITEYERATCSIKANSIIISRMNTPELVGASGFVDKDYENIFLPDRLWQTVFFTEAQIVPKWLSYFFASNIFRTVLSSLATGTSSSMKNISQEDLLGSYMCLPPIEEQNMIVQFLDNEKFSFDNLISKSQNQITFLQEYRTALISNAVTGKIDVRDTPTVILE